MHRPDSHVPSSFTSAREPSGDDGPRCVLAQAEAVVLCACRLTKDLGPGHDEPALRARSARSSRRPPRTSPRPPPDRRPQPGRHHVPHPRQPHRAGDRLECRRRARGAADGRTLHRLPQRPRPQPARVPTRPAHRGRLRRGPVPLRLRRRAAGRRPHERAHRAHHAHRGPRLRRGSGRPAPPMRFGAATGLRHLPAWKRAADFLCVQIGFSLDDLLAWRAEWATWACPCTPGSSSSPAPAWPATSPSPASTVPPDLVARLETDRNAGVDAACDLVVGIRDSGAFDGVHLIPVARYREVAARLERDLPALGLSPSSELADGTTPEVAGSAPRRRARHRRHRAASPRRGRPGRRPGGASSPCSGTAMQVMDDGLGRQHAGRRVLPHEAAAGRGAQLAPPR